ncbi:MAG: ABC-F family ATP-binding cassette domain-containing protein [Ruminococcaceae bacterium]|nr:ABC-F family ATP-binding cassette domain-containing protein [Oscillospiraceae bacterium]
MIVLSCKDVGLEYGDKTILSGITFGINEGERVGIVGVNGAGKSSLINIISGKYSASSGSVFVSGDKTIGVLEQNAALESDNTLIGEMLLTFPELLAQEKRLSELQVKLADAEPDVISAYTSLEERFREHGGYEFRSRCKGNLINMDFGEDMHGMRISALSGGQKTRLALTRLLIMNPDILILDEPTNHLDEETLVRLENQLSNYRGTLLVISHDRYFLDRVTTSILEIENHKAELYSGNYTKFVEEKKLRRDSLERAYKNQQKEIARIEAYIEQQRRWNRERNIIAAESRMKALDRMEKIDRPENAPGSIRLSFSTALASANDVLSVKGLSKSFGGKKLFDSLSFELKRSDRLFIAGPNGSGKSTLIKILMGFEEPTSGYFDFGYNIKIAYYDQENQNLDPTKTVLDELWDSYDDLTQTEIRNTLALFMFRGEDVFKLVGDLSGGERARLTLAKLILSKINLLVLDEPTNHLDINSRDALENALDAFDGTIIAVSHDRYFVKKLATRMLDLGAAPPLAFDGTYEQYQSYKAIKSAQINENEAQNSTGTLSEGKEQFLLAKERAARKRKLEKRKAFVTEEIARIEKELDRIADELAGDAGSDYILAQKLFEEQTELEETLMALYEENEEYLKDGN